MSPKNYRLINAGLTALGLFGFAPLGVADLAAPAPSAPAVTIAPTPSQAVLLLTNGNMQRGLISDGGSQYYVHIGGGKIPVPKANVETVGRTVADIYAYKLGRLPERDPDENMKLALWCLSQKMPDEAKLQLKEVLELSPKHPRALAMLESIQNSEVRAALRDPEVARAGAEVVRGRADALGPEFVPRANRALGIAGLPQIPGLNQAMSVRRAGEFKDFVEPVLQARCAKCHNEQHEGNFRLVRYKNVHDQTPDARRANLDATLAFIDLENPAKSELLSSTLRQHGNGVNARPIFRGSNDQEYRILMTWVGRLRPPRTAAEAQASRLGGPAPDAAQGGEGFASQRAVQPPLPPLTPTPTGGGRPIAPPSSDTAVPRPPGQLLPGSASGVQAYAPPDAEFPAPYLMGGPKPKPPGGPSPGAPAPPVPPPDPTGRSTMPPGVLPPPLPGLPSDAQVKAASNTAEQAPSSKKAPSKPMKLDPALLEKALMNRYVPQP